MTEDANEETFGTYYQQHYHYFITGYSGSGVSSSDFEAWDRLYDRKFDKLIKHFSSKFSLTTKIIFLTDNVLEEFADQVCRAFRKHFADKAEIIFAISDATNYSYTIKTKKAQHCPITIKDIAEGISSFSLNFGISDPYQDKYLVPFLESTKTENVSGRLPVDFFTSLENDFEVVHKGLDTYQPTEPENARDFLSGYKKISWFGLRHDWDKKHRSVKKITKTVEDCLRSGKGKIYLQHEAGYGGTTVARRIAWELHNDYPTLILKEYRGTKTVDNIIKLHLNTRKSILIVIEVPQAINFDDLDLFYRAVVGDTRPVVFLVVTRQGFSVNGKTVNLSDWGNHVFDLIHAYKPYLDEYDNQNLKNKKAESLSVIAEGDDGTQKIPFYIGLVVFEDKFFALKDYIKRFVDVIRNNDIQKKIFLYLAICHNYQAKELPSSFFNSLLKVSKKESINLEEHLPSTMISSLLTSSMKGRIKYWKPRHALFSKELKEQILRGNDVDNQDIWRQNLADYCISFVEDSLTIEQVSDYVSTLLQDLFIGTNKDRAGKTFTPIVEDIREEEAKENLFITLKNTYPENPHFCSHLARFYSYHRRNNEYAFKYANEAILLSENTGKQDPLLYHIKGMCIREAAYDLIDSLREEKYRNDTLSQEKINKLLDKLIPQAEVEFTHSRKISKKINRVAEHGYIAHIQMLIRVIDFGSIISGKSKADFLAENKQPYSIWLDTAETLLEEVKRINIDDEDSTKISQCEDGLHDLYEKYNLILQNLNNQLIKGEQPQMIRRQIVRTYFKKDNKISSNKDAIKRIMSLMETNILDEPTNEKNFYLWFKAARYSSISLKEALSKLSKWNSNSGVIDALYYFYILKVFGALQGSSEDTIDAEKLIKECKAKAPKSQNRTTCFEWYGKGNNLQKLINKNGFDSTNKESKLTLVEGYFTDFKHMGDGTITICDKLKVYFSPAQAKLTEDDKGIIVRFYLGFSYDGLRADSPSIKKANDSFFSNNQEQKHSSTPIIDMLDDDISFAHEAKNKLLEGEVIELKYPPKYTWGLIETGQGKTYLFHKNDNYQVFDKIGIGTTVNFEPKKINEKIVATNLKIIEE